MHELRLLKTSDLDTLVELSALAGWSHAIEDWASLLQLAPEGCLGVEEDGRLVSCITAITYGRELAWIGRLITHPDYRRRGYATALLQHSVDLLRHRGVNWIKADVVESAQGLCESLGFTAERPVERWLRQPAPIAVPEVNRLHPFVYDPVMERLAFGANRVALLRFLAQYPHACIPGKGYAMERPFPDGVRFGPCVARTTGAGRTLLNWFLGRNADKLIVWDLLPDNIEAAQLARETGFELSRSLVRMSLCARPDAPPFLTNESSVFAIAGFEYG